MRFLHGVPGRGRGVRLPGRGRPGARPQHRHGRGPGQRRNAAPRTPSRAAGVHRGGRGAVRLLPPRPAHRHPRPAAARRDPHRRRDPRGARGQPVPVHGLREDPGRGAPGRAAVAGACVMTSVITGGHVLTVDARRNEYTGGYVAVDGTQIIEVGPGPVPERFAGAERVDARGCLVTPGLVNTHHHLYQWATRGRAVDSGLFDWLTQLYPVWGMLDERIVGAAATAALAWLARTGAPPTRDHHYL